MVNHVFVATGQCGNQLGYELLDRLYSHSISQPHSTEDVSLDAEVLKSSLFRGNKNTGRIVCLDTEPKVIQDCINKTKRKDRWIYDPKSIAYLHGGAGNNWALGYSMASGEFLDISMNCIRREVELCDSAPVITFIHSLAGGTGSGLGTHITEEASDLFDDCFRCNIAIAPHHFGEVIVQHYNALLCVSKIYDYTNGVIIFENETAQCICKQMKGIDKPLLQDLNEAIAGTLLPMFTPRRSILSDAFHTSYHHLYDDLTLLCSHPRYRLLSVRFTPQTSNKSIAYTYDSWNTLLKTIQKIQLSSAPTESLIPSEMKTDAWYYQTTAAGGSSSSSSSGSVMKSPATPPMRMRDNNMSSSSTSSKNNNTPEKNPFPSSSGTSSSITSKVNKSMGSVVTCYGESAVSAAKKFQENIHHSFSSTATTGTTSVASAISPSILSRNGKALSDQQQDLSVFPYLSDSYASSFLHPPTPSATSTYPITVTHSPLQINRYQRSVGMISNDQTVIPVLRTSRQKSLELFTVGAYLHQYTMHGVEQDSFVSAFQSMQDIILHYDRL